MDESFRWSQGNGAVPFPGRRVETVTDGPYANMKTYEIREYLGNETVVTYRLIFNTSVPESFIWEEMEHEFRRYVAEGAS